LAPKPVEVVKPDSPKITREVPGLKPVVRKNPRTDTDRSKQQKEERDALKTAREASDKIAKQLSRTTEGLQRGFAQGTAINVYGTGGLAYANYTHFVREIYDDAWTVPSDVSLDSGVATVKVTIARDGRVVRAMIIDRSGNRVLDLSVQRALDTVTKLPPFPEGARDEERTFTIDFNLKAKRGAA
jgi:TonB family protein